VLATTEPFQSTLGSLVALRHCAQRVRSVRVAQVRHNTVFKRGTRPPSKHSI